MERTCYSSPLPRTLHTALSRGQTLSEDTSQEDAVSTADTQEEATTKRARHRKRSLATNAPRRSTTTAPKRRLPALLQHPTDDGHDHLPRSHQTRSTEQRTGVLIREVERQSDGFEDFGDLMQQVDPRTPPLKRRKRKQSEPQPEQEPEFDEDGEKSMEIDESPLRYIQTSKPASSSRRVGSSSRPVARTSDVDFDEVPSPRPQSVRGARTPRPSRLSQTIARGEFFDDEPMDIPNGQDDFDSPPHASFQDMDQDDEQLSPDVTAASAKKKGKAKAVEPEDDVEDEIQQGLNDMNIPSEEEREPTPPPPKKSKKPESKQQPEQKKVVRVRQKENRDIPLGVRRSTRVSIEPLQWWRGEKVVYGRTGDEHDPILVAPIKEIQRIKAIPEPPLGGKKPARKRKRAATPAEAPENPANPEEGWDDATTGLVKILSFPDADEVERQIAFTARMMKPTMAPNNEWYYQRLFGDGQFMAAGELIIPPMKRKQTKKTKDNTFVFYVIEGAVNLKVHEASMVLATGAAFMVPRGNSYFIENVGKRDAKLFFSQARVEPAEVRRASSVKRSSVAAPSSDPPSQAVARRAASSKI
ncbi:hypothetical protein BDZ89DRAFT_1157975 [Hymenopellis radicata]|nr:hypothetical protein BDZ89DRAFT_1157975 [Hymenopellis radicata]